MVTQIKVMCPFKSCKINRERALIPISCTRLWPTDRPCFFYYHLHVNYLIIVIFSIFYFIRTFELQESVLRFVPLLRKLYFKLMSKHFKMHSTFDPSKLCVFILACVLLKKIMFRFPCDKQKIIVFKNLSYNNDDDEFDDVSFCWFVMCCWCQAVFCCS